VTKLQLRKAVGQESEEEEAEGWSAVGLLVWMVLIANASRLRKS
jgi:hypothetical protein